MARLFISIEIKINLLLAAGLERDIKEVVGVVVMTGPARQRVYIPAKRDSIYAGRPFFFLQMYI